MINVTKSSLPKLEEYTSLLRRVWETGIITNDAELTQLLSSELQTYLKSRKLLLISNGTLALHLVLKCLKIGGEVITTPFTFAATTNAIVWEGFKPVFADIDSETFNLDPMAVERKITKKTCAILAVHVYGNPCYLEAFADISSKYNIPIIYDAAHAFGVEYKNESVLKYGNFSVLSFHATKVFNTIEGGAIITDNDECFEKLRLMRNHGIKTETEVLLPGTNAKMNEFQAAMGLCNLKKIDDMIYSRRLIYEQYIKNLKDNKNLRFQKIMASKYNYSYMPILFRNQEQRDKVYLRLLENGIKCRKYFFPLTSDFDYFKAKKINNVFADQLINAHNISRGILCLPLYPNLNISIVEKISSLIIEIIDDRSS